MSNLRGYLGLLAAAALVAALIPATAATAGNGDADGRASAAGEAPAAQAAHHSHPAGGVTVTLVTGDRVTVGRAPDGTPTVTTDPDGRDGQDDVVLNALEEDGQLYVIPSDAAPLVPEVLDRELFNVTKLAEAGHTGGVPVIVTRDERAGLRPLRAPSGMTATSALSSIDAVVATIEGDGSWWQDVQGHADGRDGPEALAQAAPFASIDKVWLDDQVEVALDESVAHVGAPAAWDTGLDGEGVRVAVIDTGIDASHPDFGDRIVASRSFVPGEGVADGHGHGTHVASIAAGDGAASGGDYTGVAPAADLIVGKALDDEGTGATSQVIEAMEWATLEEGADIVNLSVGSDPTDGTDPASEAIDQLTEQTGALFVASAGNAGPSDLTVGAPGAATAALTVGATNTSDELASFSSRGPRLEDHALKPEIVAPGVEIVAARADGTEMGAPVDDDHTATSGTSMSAPHVAGAAALLRQQRADWGPAAVKASLVSSAEDVGLSVYEQGGGRLDVDRATAQDVQVAPATADFGLQPWPQEGPPRTEEITYTNPTDEDVTLDLNLTAETVGGDPVDGDVLALEPSTLDLAPGESASATLTLDQTAADEGLHTGSVVATDGDLRLSTPVGFSIEEEQHTVSIHVDERDDVDDFQRFTMHLYAVDGSWAGEFWDVNCAGGCPDPVEFSVPEGVYHTRAYVNWWEGDVQPRAVLLDPEFSVAGDTEVTLDANAAEQVTFDTPLPSDPADSGALAVYRSSADEAFGLTALLAPSDVVDWYMAPTEKVTKGNFWTGQHWLLNGPEEDGEVPYVYQAKLYEDLEIPSSLHYELSEDDVASVDNHIHSDDPDTPLSMTNIARRPEEYAFGNVSFDVPAGSTFREYVGRLSSDVVFERRLDTDPASMPHPIDVGMAVFDEPDHREVRWNAGFKVPGVLRQPDASHLGEGLTTRLFNGCAGCRQSDGKFFPFMHLTSPERKHSGGYFGSILGFLWGEEVRLYRDGEEIEPAEPAQGFFVNYDLPDETGEYELELEHGDTRTNWEFSSGPVTDDETPSGYRCVEEAFTGEPVPCRAEPLIFLGYDVPVGLDNAVAGSGAHKLTVEAQRQSGDAPALEGLEVWFSTDGGADWKPVRGLRSTGDDTYTGNVVVPALHRTTGTVSLRAHAWDGEGNRVEQTVLDAYDVR